MSSGICLLVLVAIQIYGVILENVSLTISDGEILGQVNTTIRRGIAYHSFRGIPYAQPPVGDLRFKSPVKNSAWDGTYNATYDRPECIQYSYNDILGTTMYGQEDCLYINVYKPDTNATGLPVLVWIYGGAFLTGNSSYVKFGPDFFLEQGLIFVSFNYRLGIFGFLSTQDEACPGNWGIKDQILALNWVQENIGYFGGDPKNVTIFGESAGAVSVSLLMQTNLTEGLFERAIMDSGTSLNLWGLNTRPNITSNLVAISLDIITDNSTELVEGLRGIDAETLQKAAWTIAWGLFITDGLRGLPWGPVMEPDVEGAVYLNPSEYALSQGNFRQVPVLMGFNSQEAAAAADIPFLLRFYLLYYDVAVSILPPYDLTQNEITRYVAGTDVQLEYFGLIPIAASTQNLVNFVSADQFNRPIRKAATEMSKYTAVYFYQFGYEGEISGVTERIVSGVSHTEDLHYLFRSYNNYTSTDIKVSEMMVLLWSNFAKYSNPTPIADPNLNNTIWNPVDANSTNFNYMSLNESMVEEVNPKQADWVYYTNLWQKFGDGSEYTTF